MTQNNDTDNKEKMEADELEHEAEQQEAREVIEKLTSEDIEEDEFGDISIKSIFGGDILKSRFVMKQIAWFIFVVILMIIYTANRYSAQQDIIRISELREELQEMKYKVLTQSSELMNRSRQSNVENYLKQTNDSTLVNPTSPPYLVK